MPAQTRFSLELERDFAENYEGEYADLLREVAEKVFDIAKARTAKRTGKMRGAWGISVGSKPNFSRKGKRDLAKISLLAIQSPLGMAKGVFVHNSDFRASWFEHGTVKMAPRSMLRPAIFFTRSMRR